MPGRRSLRQLPGIALRSRGRASFAFERRAAWSIQAVHGCCAGFAACQSDRQGDSGCYGTWRSAVPTRRAAWTHNQALMELGALVCTAQPCTAARADQAALP
jgi:A/G-specific adenine glycosylase